MPTSIDGYKIYRSHFLLGYSRPLVFATRSEYATVGLSMIRVESIVVHPAGPAQMEVATLDKRYLPRNENIERIVEALAEAALDRAEDALEKLTGQGVVLEEIERKRFLACAQREGWVERWPEVLDMTYCGSLQTLLREMEDSPLRRYNMAWKTMVARQS